MPDYPVSPGMGADEGKEGEKLKGAIHPFSLRQQMLDDRFEIHRYRDPSPGPVELHHHDFFEVYFFLSGPVSYHVESRTYTLAPRDILLISPTELHQPVFSARNREPYERIVLWLQPAFLDALSSGKSDLRRCFDVLAPGHVNLLRPDPVAGQQLFECAQALLGCAQAQTEGEFGADLICNARLIELLVALNRQAQRQPRSYALPEERSAPFVASALQYIGEHYASEITLDELAARCFVSKYHLSREFRRLVGSPVYRYIMQKRLIMARQRLLAGESPTNIYAGCGFGDYANFYRAFRNEYGISPSAFARSARGGE